MRTRQLRALGRFAISAAAVCLTIALLSNPIAVQSQAVPPASQQAASAAPTLPDGQTVVVVRIVTDAGQVLEENPALAAQAGKPFDSEAVRESLKQLHRTGLYSDVQAQTTAVPGGVRLDFVVRRNFYVNQVRVEGLREPPGQGVALAALRLKLGVAFREGELEEGLKRLMEVLREDGFYQAQVAHELTPHPETRQMDIVVRVIPGPRATQGVITVHNQTQFPDAELLKRSRLKPGRPVTLRRLSNAAERIRTFLTKKDHLSARVEVRRGEYDAKSVTVPLTVEILAGPVVRLEATGEKFSSKELRKLVPIYQEGTVDEDLLQEGRRQIRDFLEREGFFQARVGNAIAHEAGKTGAGKTQPATLISYPIQRGPRQRLVGVSIEGNRYFGDELLLGRLRIRPAGFADRGRFSQRLLAGDVDSMRDLYIANGFRNAQVTTSLEQDYRGKEGDLFVRFQVQEGPQTRVAELTIEGSSALSADRLLDVVGSTAGQPYSDFNVSSDRDNILALYYNRGFPEARFSATAEEVTVPSSPPAEKPGGGSPGSGQQAGANGPQVRLTYRIAEGRQLRIKDVLLSGYEHTRRNVMEREVKLRPGEAVSEGAVVQSQHSLYDLGVFSRVDIAPQNPDGTATEKTMVVLVEEAKRYSMAYGFGLEAQRLGGSTTDPAATQFRLGPRGLFEIAKSNLTGRADTLGFKLRGGTLQSRGLISYTAPNFFGWPALSLQLTALADRARDVRTFTSTKYEGALQLAQRVTPTTSMLYRYIFRRVTVDDLRISAGQIPLFNQPTLVSGFAATWVRDRRDPPTNPTQGNFNTVDVAFNARALGSSASFFRFFAQNSAYHRLSRRLAFVRSTRFGVEEPVGSSLSSNIPLPERFFAGGGTSLRGYGLNQAGPRDPITGFPIGGRAELIFNQELRFPMRLPWVGDRLGGAVFYDAGNVFASTDRITLRPSPTQASIANGELSYFSHTVGFSVLYSTAVVPIRVDLGLLLNPAKFQFCSPATSGSSPVCPMGQVLKTERLPRFQIFFNLGAVF